MSVNGLIASRIFFADGPFPTIKSRAKSSIAGYKISSTLLLSLCISSMNKTSLSLRFVKIAARSAACSIAGPEVILN